MVLPPKSVKDICAKYITIEVCALPVYFIQSKLSVSNVLRIPGAGEKKKNKSYLHSYDEYDRIPFVN